MSVVLSEKNIVAEIVSSIERSTDVNDAFSSLRLDALRQFERMGLPGSKHEEYKHTPITRALEKNFSFTLPNAPAGLNDINHLLISAEGVNVLVFINGIFSKENSTIKSRSLVIAPMSEAVTKYRDVLSQHLGQIADASADAFAAWNTAAWTDGLFVHVPHNTVVEEPILMYHIHDATAGQVVTAARNVVIVGKSSEVTILEKFDTLGTGNGFSTNVSEAKVEENAALNWFIIQNDQGNRYQFDLKQVHQARNSRVNTYTFTMDGKAIRNTLQLAIDGEGIDSHMYGLYLLGKDTLADNHTVVDHRQPNSFSNEMYKGIMDDSSRGVFNGKIYVRPNAQKTNAFQANRNILLSDKATVNTKPQLEIWADDVKCSHGCTSGQLDEEALFYLRARGISKETARAMMLYAFAGELLETVKSPFIKEYIDALVSERLHKNF
jgi:Fe-S cluster assembly protein SufD